MNPSIFIPDSVVKYHVILSPNGQNDRDRVQVEIDADMGLAIEIEVSRGIEGINIDVAQDLCYFPSLLY